MGTTTNFEIPYPEDEDLVTLGANAMQALAEQVDTIVRDDIDLRAYVQLFGDGNAVSATGRVGWAVGTPILSRGSWTYANSNRLILPPEPGLYLVSATIPVDVAATGASLRIETRVSTDDDSVVAVIALQGTSDNNSTFVNASGIAYVDTTPNKGIQVRAGDDTLAVASSSCRVQIHQLSRI